MRCRSGSPVSHSPLRAGFTLSRALFRKKCGGPSTRAADPIFPGKNWRPFFSHHRVSAVTSPQKLATYFLLITLLFTRGSPIFPHAKKLPLLLWGTLFVGALVRPNMLNHAKSAAEACWFLYLLTYLLTYLLSSVHEVNRCAREYTKKTLIVFEIDDA